MCRDSTPGYLRSDGALACSMHLWVVLFPFYSRESSKRQVVFVLFLDSSAWFVAVTGLGDLPHFLEDDAPDKSR